MGEVRRSVVGDTAFGVGLVPDEQPSLATLVLLLISAGFCFSSWIGLDICGVFWYLIGYNLRLESNFPLLVVGRWDRRVIRATAIPVAFGPLHNLLLTLSDL